MDNTRISGNLWGATTQIVTVNDGAGNAPVRIFIEFLPGGLFQLTGYGQAALTDGIFQLGDVMPELYAALCHLLESALCVDRLVEGLDQMLLPVLLTREAPCAALSASAVLRRARGMLTVESLAACEGYSSRHLNRVLNEYLGMGPKQFARLLRINATVRLLGSGLPLTYLAQESGFYDQAHFIRDFSKICGVTPGGYLDKMSDFYNEPLKF